MLLHMQCVLQLNSSRTSAPGCPEPPDPPKSYNTCPSKCKSPQDRGQGATVPRLLFLHRLGFLCSGRAGLLTPIKQDIWNTLLRGRMSRLQGVCTPLLAPHQSKLHILVVISIVALLATLVTKSHDPLSSSLFSGSLKIKVLYTVSERLAPCLLALRFRRSICQLPDAGHLELRGVLTPWNMNISIIKRCSIV